MSKLALNTTLGSSVSPSFVTAINSNFTKLQDALSEVEQWKPAMFAYKARGILPKSALQMGFIANDLVAVSPECVTGKGLGEEWDENAPEGAYELVPVAIMAKMARAIQQLSERLKELEAK